MADNNHISSDYAHRIAVGGSRRPQQVSPVCCFPAMAMGVHPAAWGTFLYQVAYFEAREAARHELWVGQMQPGVN